MNSSLKLKLLLILLIILQYGVCIILSEPLNFFKNKFQAKIDTNPYYYF